MGKKIWVSAAIVCALGLIGAACGHPNITATIEISGSSTVEPISVRVAELFETSPSNTTAINIDGPGTGDGFKLFCEGETDVSDASRAIKPSEAATCQENGVKWVELQVAIDGIAVITSNNNNAVDCITLEQLYALIGPEARSKNNWSDANALVAGSSNLPDADLKIFGPGEESGTFDSFVELAIGPFAEERGQDITTRPDYTASADDNVIIRGIQNLNTSLGWVGFAFAVNTPDIKLLEVDGGNGCVAPTSANISSGEYPIARPLFIYVNLNRAGEVPEIVSFIDFYLSDSGLVTAVFEVGYVELDEAAKTATRQAWQNR